MSKTIFDTSIKDIIPDFLTNDEDISALIKALDIELQKISLKIKKNIILSKVDELDENVLDLLASQFDVDYYHRLGTTIEKKRELIKKSITWHRQKGTKKVLEDMLKTIYTKKFNITEWFEYGGEPFYFRVELLETIFTKEDYKNLIDTINNLKNVRSKLEYITKSSNVKTTMYFGALINKSKRTKIPYTNPSIELSANFKNKVLINITKTTRI